MVSKSIRLSLTVQLTAISRRKMLLIGVICRYPFVSHGKNIDLLVSVERLNHLTLHVIAQ